MNRENLRHSPMASLLPDATRLLKSSLFFVIVFVIGNLLFTLFATLLYVAKLSDLWMLLIALAISSIVIIAAYQHYYYKIVYSKQIPSNTTFSQCQITLKSDESFSQFINNPESSIEILASKLDISVSQIKLIDTLVSIQQVKLSLPSYSIDKLIDLCETHRMSLSSLGISYVAEVVNEPYRLDNIRKLLLHAFSIKDLLSFYGEFIQETNTVASRNKGKVVAAIIAYAQEKDLVHQILDVAQKTKLRYYEKFAPYYNVPRKSFDKVRFEQVRLDILQKKLRSAWIKGISTSAIGSAIIFILVFALYLATPSSSFGAFGWIFIAPLGRHVAKVVLNTLGNELRPVVGKIPLLAFLTGFLLAPVLLCGVVLFVGFTVAIFSVGPLDALLKVIANIPLFLALLGLIENMFLTELFFDTILILSIFSGCYLASIDVK